MKLVQIWNTREAFARLSALKKPPKLAYRLLKYVRKFEVELAACEAHRIKCVYEVAGLEPGTPGINLLPGTPEFDAFMVLFNLFLANDSDLEPVGIGMETLIEALDAEIGNTLSENDLALLEVFFTVKSPPDLKLVENVPGVTT